MEAGIAGDREAGGLHPLGAQVVHRAEATALPPGCPCGWRPSAGPSPVHTPPAPAEVLPRRRLRVGVPRRVPQPLAPLVLDERLRQPPQGPGASRQTRRVTELIPAGLTAADEARHAPGEGDWWGESWYFDFATARRHARRLRAPRPLPQPDGGLVLGLRGGRGPAAGDGGRPRRRRPPGRRRSRSAPRACGPTTRSRRRSTTCRSAARRSPWGSTIPPRCTTARAAGGDRVPFGLDLEWETDGAAYAYPPGTTRYEVPCRVHGEVLVGDERIELDGFGERDHSWGVRDWWTFGWSWTAGWLDDGTRFHGTAVRLGDDVVVPPRLRPAARRAAGGRRAHRGDLGARRHGLPDVGHRRLRRPAASRSSRWRSRPVLLDDGAGRVSRFPRALCRFRDAATGRTGAGWVEWNQPQ